MFKAIIATELENTQRQIGARRGKRELSVAPSRLRSLLFLRFKFKSSCFKECYYNPNWNHP